MLKLEATLSRTISAVALALIVLAGGVRAGTFDSFSGQFHFDYPESWIQVDYTTAEYYLYRGNPEDSIEFEAVFSEKQTFVLYQGQYLILTVDTIGAMSPERVDSVLESVSEEFGRPLEEVSSDQFLSRSMTDSITVDRENNLVAIQSEVAGGDAGPRVNLLVMKMYEHGIANFYFYAPKVEFEASLPIYAGMVNSFALGTAEGASEEDVRVGDIKEKQDKGGIPVAVYGGLIAVLIALIASRRRRKARKDDSSKPA